MCIRCGYRGPELQSVRGDAACFECPKCGFDLYAHPPRSYAEMEGLEVDAEPPLLDRLSTMLGGVAEEPGPQRVKAARLLRWVGLGVIGLAAATAAAAMTLALAGI